MERIGMLDSCGSWQGQVVGLLNTVMTFGFQKSWEISCLDCQLLKNNSAAAVTH